MAPISHRDFPQSPDCRSGIGHRGVHADRGRGMADDDVDQQLVLYRVDPDCLSVAILPIGSARRLDRDVFDRRNLILGTEIWMLAFIATVLTSSSLSTGTMTPCLLLLLTLALSLGDAIGTSDVACDIPCLVKKDDLTAALALNGIEFNLLTSRRPGTCGPDYRGCRCSDNFPLQCAFVFRSDHRHFYLETPHAKKQIASGNPRWSQRCGNSLPSVTHLAFGHYCCDRNCHLYASSFGPFSRRVVKGTEQECTGYGFLLGFFGVGAVLGAVVLHVLSAQNIRQASAFSECDGDVRCNSPQHSSAA